MLPREKLTIVIAVAIFVFAISLPFWASDLTVKSYHDEYRYQTIDDDDIRESTSPLGKYVMTVSPVHDADVIIQQKFNYSRVPYISSAGNMTGLGYTKMMKGQTYTIYFNTLIDAQNYHLLLHWKEC